MEVLNQPLVSIIVVTYNSSKYVLETLESARKQTYQNIELIITDDCSADNTLEICQDWIENNEDRFVRSVVISVEQNTGIPANCNRGVRNSEGQWVKLIAGDDMLLKSCIEDNVEYVYENPSAKFVVSDLLEINDEGFFFDNRKAKIEKDNRLKFFFNAKAAEKQLKAYSRWPVFLNAPTFFIDKQLLTDINFFDAEYRVFEDMPLIYRITSKGVRVYFMNKPTVKYRIHDKAISRKVSNNNERNKEVLSVFKKYRAENLSIFNLIDLSIYYECWITYSWKGIRGHKGSRILSKVSLFYWYIKYKIFIINNSKCINNENTMDNLGPI